MQETTTNELISFQDTSSYLCFNVYYLNIFNKNGNTFFDLLKVYIILLTAKYTIPRYSIHNILVALWYNFLLTDWQREY